MFSNIGGKIQTTGKALCWIGIICSVASGLGMVIYGVKAMQWEFEHGLLLVLGGVGVTLLGALLSWVGSFFVIGFGVLVENSDTLAANAEKGGY